MQPRWPASCVTLICWALILVAGSLFGAWAEDLENVRAESSRRHAILEQLKNSGATTDQLEQILEIVTRSSQVNSNRVDSQPEQRSEKEAQVFPVWATDDPEHRQLHDRSDDEIRDDLHLYVISLIKTITIAIAVGIVVLEVSYILVHFGIIPKPGFKINHGYEDQEVFHRFSDTGVESTRILSDDTYLNILTGASDQAWCEELGLCETEAGEQRWFRKSHVDPAQSHAEHASTYLIEDTCAAPGGKELRLAATASSEEKRVVQLHRNCLERERYVNTTFRKLFLRQVWASEPGNYPGPAFQTREDFTRGCHPRHWPIAARRTQFKIDISELTALELVGELRRFIWRNNAEGSWKATLIVVLLGSSTFPSIFLFGKIVDVISNADSNVVLTLPLVQIPMCSTGQLMLLTLASLLLEVVCSYMSYVFWTVVPKYSVLRQFQSFFGRQGMEILMRQAGSESQKLKSAHENLFKSSPGLCQAMTNYCCEGVVINLWGKSFDRSQACATLCTAILLILYSFTQVGPSSDQELSRLQCLALNLKQYGAYLTLFAFCSTSLFLINGLSRLKESVDMWGVATKTKLNMMSLQQELTLRMMRVGKNKLGADVSIDDQRTLEEACGHWHDACRIYCNRDFHTWFVSWIIIDNSNKMLNAVSVALATLVLGCDVLEGHMTAGTFVVIVGAVQKINTAFTSMLSYYLSLPEGYICLLYLAQVCNLTPMFPGSNKGLVKNLGED